MACRNPKARLLTVCFYLVLATLLRHIRDSFCQTELPPLLRRAKSTDSPASLAGQPTGTGVAGVAGEVIKDAGNGTVAVGLAAGFSAQAPD
jgi:hypothetical protein